MNSNETQARWISERGHVDQAVIQQIWPLLAKTPELDLCELLVKQGHLSSEQAEYVRSQIGKESSGLITPIEAPRSASSASFEHSEIRNSTFQHPNYEVLGELGRGGMGVVYLGRQRASGVEVVIKCLLETSQNAELIERFQREARVLGQFNHENIVAIKDFGFQQGQPYIVMNRIEGIDLEAHVKQLLKVQGSVPDQNWTLSRLIELARGLEECHRKGIIHRDLKPANVMIETETERPVLIDFGVASIGQSQSSSDAFKSMAQGLTETGVTVGTPAYMAPEQLDGAGSESPVTIKADVWSFGAILYFCLTGTAPYTGATPYSIYKKLIESDPSAPSQVNGNVPKWLDEICQRIMVRDPEQRPEMREIIAWLDGIASPRQKRPLKPLLGALFLLLLAAVMAYFVFHGTPDTRPPTTPKMITQNEMAFRKIGDDEYNVFTKEKLLSIEFQSFDESLSGIVAVEKNTKKLKSKGRTEGNGRFTINLSIEEDVNEFLIYAVDRQNNRSQPASITVLFDSKIPHILEFDRPDRLRSKSLKGDATFVLSGLVDEDDCELFYNQTKAKVTGRHFILPITLDKRTPKIEVLVRDRVGLYRRVEVPIRVVSSEKGAGRTHSNIDTALRGLKDDWLIFVRPGVYQSVLKISKNVRIEASGEVGDVIIQSKKGTLVKVESRVPPVKASIKGISLIHGSEVEENLLELREGQLTLENCELQGYKILALCGPDEPSKTKAPQAALTLKDCRLIRYWAYGIVARKTTLNVTNCEFIDRNSTPSGGWYRNEDSKDPFFHRGALLIRDQSNVTVKNSRFMATKHRHMFIWKSQATIEGCKFLGSYEDGLYFSKDSKSTLKNCTFEDGSEETILAFSCQSLEIDNCHILSGGLKFFKDANEGTPVEGISAAILLRDGAKVTIRRSSVKNYAGAGLFLEDNDLGPKEQFKSSVRIFNSEFCNNGGAGVKIQKGDFFAENCKFSGNKKSGLFGCMGAELHGTKIEIENNKLHGVHLISRTRARLYKATVNGNTLGLKKLEGGSILGMDGQLVK